MTMRPLSEFSADARRRFGDSIVDIGLATTVSSASDRTDSATPSYGKQLLWELLLQKNKRQISTWPLLPKKLIGNHRLDSIPYLD